MARVLYSKLENCKNQVQVDRGMVLLNMSRFFLLAYILNGITLYIVSPVVVHYLGWGPPWLMANFPLVGLATVQCVGDLGKQEYHELSGLAKLGVHLYTLYPQFFAYTFRAVGRSENPWVPVLFGGHNLSPLAQVGLTDLPKSGGAMAPTAPPGTTGLTLTIFQPGGQIQPLY